MNDIKIKKRDGMLEDFNFDKLIISIGKAGISIEDAQSIANEVKNWLYSNKAGIVESNIIRDKIIDLMSDEFPAEADSYKAYKK